MSKTRPILLSTLEISGDEYAGWLIEQYKSVVPQAHFIGLGGDNAQAAGMALNAHFKDHACMAVIDVIKKFKVFKALLNDLVETMDREKPSAVVLIDSSGFNLRLAREAHKRNIPVLYLIPPKVWAWATWRIKKIRRYCTSVACMYDFETTFFKQNNISATTIINPRDALLRSSNKYTKGLYAICPGSRVGEIKNNLPNLLKACLIIQKEQPSAKFVIVIANHRLKQYIKDISDQYEQLNIELIEQNQKKFLAQADVALATSGTLTYELMMLKTPMVVVYKTSQRLSYYIVKEWLFKPNWVSLPNLIANRTIVPELLQQKMTPNRIATQALNISNNTQTRTHMVKQLNALREQSSKHQNKTLGEILHAFISQ